MGLGYWADSSFETEPVFLLVGLALGFATFVVRLVQMRKLVEEAAAEVPDAAPTGGTNDEVSRVLERIRERNQRENEAGSTDDDWDTPSVWSIDHGDDDERE